jgi:hypothetical protein
MEKQIRNEAEAQAVAGSGADRGTTMEGQIEEHVPTPVVSSSESANETLNGSKTTVKEPAAPVAKEESSANDPEASRTKLQTVIIMLSLCSSVFLA